MTTPDSERPEDANRVLTADERWRRMTPEQREAALAAFRADQQRQFERLAPKAAARFRAIRAAEGSARDGG